MADLRDEFGNPIMLSDEHGNPVQLKDEHGKPMHLTGVTVSQEKSTLGSVLHGGDAGGHYGGTETGGGVYGDAGGHYGGIETGGGVYGSDVGIGTDYKGENFMSGPGDGVISGQCTAKTVEQELERKSSSSSSSESDDDGQGGRIRKKKGLGQKIKEKLTGGKTKEPHTAGATTTTATTTHHEEPLEKKSMMEKIKEKLPGHHPVVISFLVM